MHSPFPSKTRTQGEQGGTLAGHFAGTFIAEGAAACSLAKYPSQNGTFYRDNGTFYRDICRDTGHFRRLLPGHSGQIPLGMSRCPGVKRDICPGREEEQQQQKVRQKQQQQKLRLRPQPVSPPEMRKQGSRSRRLRGFSPTRPNAPQEPDG